MGPALITVGALMMMNAVRIKWDQAGEALPAFITMIIMPLTYSIAFGVALMELFAICHSADMKLMALRKLCRCVWMYKRFSSLKTRCVRGVSLTPSHEGQGPRPAYSHPQVGTTRKLCRCVSECVS